MHKRVMTRHIGALIDGKCGPPPSLQLSLKSGHLLFIGKYLQCCERQMNLCMSRESLLWQLCPNDLKLFLCLGMEPITKF